MSQNAESAQRVTFAVNESDSVSGLLFAPEGATACFVFAHGAGAGMTHPFMAAIAAALAARRIATLRYQFPYMEKKSRRPDPPQIAQHCVRAAVAEAARLAPGLPLIAGGKSFGGRMTSQAQARAPLPDVRGLVFLGFPLHPAGKPSSTRGDHLEEVRAPMLFLQGARDKLAELPLIEPLCARLATATLLVIEGADHSFRIPARNGRKDADVLAELADAIAAWTGRMLTG